ncbi:MAG: DNA-binding transcriptional regulator [Gemmataceae bacterium]|nr:DNA-binding transcriptional regulator [Gemmataceae bacterium]
MGQTKRVAIAVNMNKAYDRQVVAGIARYARGRGDWSLYTEDETLAKLPDLAAWHGDGIVADLDDRRVARAVARVAAPVVGFGGAQSPADRLAGRHYVASDDRAVGRLAADHLLDRGFRHFAYYGEPPTPLNPWSAARGRAFRDRVEAAGHPCAAYTGRHATAVRWEPLLDGLRRWLARLPTPLGLMACHDARARHVLEACHRLGRRVPDDVAVIGVDNDDVMCDLAHPPLSSVAQGTNRMGYEAAALLDRLMAGDGARRSWVLVPPAGVVTRRSTDVLAVADPKVAEAIRFVRDHVADGLRAGDVARHVRLSRAALDQHFVSAVGRTAHDEIHRAQLARAKDLLATTDLPLKQVAHQAGFSSVQYLTTVFHRELGRTPAEYRRAGPA